MPAPSTTDVINAILTARYIRSSKTEEKFCDNHFRVLCYLAEATKISNRPQHSSFHRLSFHFDGIVGVSAGLSKTLVELIAIDSMDKFSNEIESIRTVLIADSTASFNNLYGPSFASGDSSIGLFLRYIWAWWECLQFDESCQVFSSVKHFLTAKEGGIENVHDTHIHQNNVTNSSFRFCIEPNCMNSAEEGDFDLISGDVRSVESRIHRELDLFSNELTTPLSTADTKSTQASSVSTALARLLQNDALVEFRVKEPQHAMLSIAHMWQRANNPTMALSAIEEALKTAHQLGDHTTVAHALLLLYDVFSTSRDSELTSSAEDILLRCSQRCAALGLQHLTAKCTLLLAQLHAQRLFPVRAETHNNDMYKNSKTELLVASTCGSHESGGEPGREVAGVWEKMSFALLGEISLSSQVVTKRGITDDSEFSQTGSSTNPMLSHLNQQQAGAAKKENIREVPMNISFELARLACEAHIMSASVWTRLGMLSMAELSLRRAMRNFDLPRQGPGALADICGTLLVVQTDLATIGRNTNNATATGVECVLRFGKIARTALTGIVSDSFMEQRLDVPLLYVLYQLAVQHDNYEKALRLADRMVFITSPQSISLMTNLTCTPNYNTNSGAEDCRMQAGLSEVYLRSKALLIEATARLDANSSRYLRADFIRHLS